MKKLSDKARMYARSYGQPPYGRETEGTAELLLEMADKLEEYEDLEEQGKLPKLPCAVGDDVWYISERVEKQGRKKVEISFVDHGVVDNITLGHMMIPQITVCNGENVWTTFDGVEDFGKTVFLTREEAEAALKVLAD